MEAAWKRMEQLLQSRTVRAGLKEGGSAEQLSRVPAELVASFPEEFRQSYLIHDGQNPNAPDLVGTRRMLSLDEIVETWRMWKKLDDGGEFKGAKSRNEDYRAEGWWNRGWIPFTTDGGGDSHCIDLDPGPTGKSGQVILLHHDAASRPLVAKSFAEWLVAVADELEFDYSHSKSQVESGTESRSLSMDELIDVVGRNIGDNEVKALLSGQILEKSEGMRSGETRLLNKAGGYSITLNRIRIIRINLQITASGEYQAFPGDLSDGIKSRDDRQAIRTRLGMPASSSDSLSPAPKTSWDRYDKTNVSIRINYLPTSRIDFISLTAPDATSKRAK